MTDKEEIGQRYVRTSRISSFGFDELGVTLEPPAVIEELAKAGKIERERVTVGRVGLGVAVRMARHGSLRPVSSEET
jgi:hypothetical protein